MKFFPKLKRNPQISLQPAILPNHAPKSAHLIEEFTKLCHQRDIHRAINAMRAMQTHGLCADCISYSQLINSCISYNAIEHGKLVHKHLISNGYKPKAFLLNILLNMYVKFNLFETAHKLFDEMPERNVVSWTTMISAYSNAKNGSKALEFLILMTREGVKPNVYTFSSVLRACDGLLSLKEVHCCIFKYGFDYDVFVLSALINVYAKWGELEDAIRVFDSIVTKNLVVWNSIIAAFAQNTDANEALNMFKRMKRAGLFADQAVLTSTLRACTGLALLELGKQVHVHVLKYDNDLILNNAILDMYCKCGSLEEAKAIFSRMLEKDVVSWSTMIIGLAQNGFSNEALALFERMKQIGTRPNYVTILGVLFACSHAGLLKEGWYYFRSMKRLFGIDPTREHYGCMIDLLGRAGKLNDVVRLIHEMGCEPDVVTWRALLGACRVHRNPDLATYSAKQIIRLEPDDVGTYVLLSNIYANSHRWEDVMDLRRSMREKGIKKEPGCSWIEVNRKIHTFLFRDKSHPQINEIVEELKRLISRLRDMGYFPDTKFVLQDLEGEQKEESLQYHSEKMAIAFGLMSLPREMIVRIRKNIRICGDCHLFAKLVSKAEGRTIVIRDPIRYHHFKDGVCSCGDYW